MKGPKGFGTGGPMDLGTVFDEIFEAAQSFQDEFQRKFGAFGPRPGGERGPNCWSFDENTDYSNQNSNNSDPSQNNYGTDNSDAEKFAQKQSQYKQMLDANPPLIEDNPYY